MTDTTLTTGAASSQLAVPMVPTRSTGRWKEPPPLEPTAPKKAEFADLKPVRQGSPLVPFLVSTIIHTLLLILLALLTYKTHVGSESGLTARQGEATRVVELQAIESDPDRVIASEGALAEQPVAIHFAPADPATISSLISDLTSASETELAEIPEVVLGSAGGTPSPLARLPGGGLSGRTPEGRIELGKKYGATGASEQAVEDALRYLAAHQRPDGSWSFNLKLDPCNGRCSHSTIGGESPAPSTAATGLALLAFLGAGHTHVGDGPYAKTVRRGIYYLRNVAAESDAGYDWQKGSMYGHGIALMALGEALSMTSEPGKERESDLYELVQRGAQFTCIAQHSNGSWGYYPKSPGDTTVTGWQVLSLIAAKRSQVDLQTFTLQNAKDFLMSTCKNGDYWFGYKGPPGEPTTTAIGLTLMLYLGASPERTEFLEALNHLAARGPMFNNIYHDYYATMAMHHARHRDWDRWNQTLRDHLIHTQEKEGHEKGSWHFPDKYGDVGGRLYTTAMCALTLEVYYRYLPMYEAIEDFPLE